MERIENELGEVSYRIRFLVGTKELKPLEYTITDHGNGNGTLQNEFMSLNGDLKDIMRGAAVAGIKYKYIKGAS